MLEAFHIDGALGALMGVLHSPPAGLAPRGTIIHVPAFGEEMNKSRRMVALCSGRLAQCGWRVLLLDLSGCGDSAGELEDVQWSHWIEDVRAAADWASGVGPGPLWLWGHRLGAVLAAEASAYHKLECGLLLWQPVTHGRQHLQQFLRLWQGARIVGKAADGSDESPQVRLKAGLNAEVAGYVLSAALASGIEGAELARIHAPLGVRGFSVSSTDSPQVPPALRRLAERWARDGIDCRLDALSGVPFWQTQEIELAPLLVEHTILALGGDHA